VKGVLSDTLVAAKTILSDGCLRIFVPCALILNLLAAGAFSLMLPFCMEKGFTVDTYGYLVSIYSAACLVAVLMLGIVKLKPKTQFWFMSLGFTVSIPFMISVYFSQNFILMCVFAFMAGFLNCIGNSIFNASMMLALPEMNRSAILGTFRSACVGGSALSAVLYGLLGEVFPLYITFAIGSALSLPLMIFMCFHPRIKQFIQNRDETMIGEET
jgi:MFS family permease